MSTEPAPKVYEPCPRCADDRARGQLTDCYGCKGKGMRRVPSNYLCNKCGGPMGPEPEAIHNLDSTYGLIEASVQGGYDSPHLTDCTRYEFSLCEGCLRELFAAFAIAPRTSGHNVDGEGDEKETYADDYEGYRYRTWQRAGHDVTAMRKGLCNAARECPNPAAWRMYYSTHLSTDCCCSAHADRFMYANAERVPFEEVRSVVHTGREGDELTHEENLCATEAWLRLTLATYGEPRPGHTGAPLYWRYLPSHVGDLLGIPDDDQNASGWSGVFVKGSQRLRVRTDVRVTEIREIAILGGYLIFQKCVLPEGVTIPYEDPVRPYEVEFRNRMKADLERERAAEAEQHTELRARE